MLKIKRLTETAKIPTAAHKGDMWDIYADENVALPVDRDPFGIFDEDQGDTDPLTIKVSTGVCLGIPEGFRIEVKEKSGLSKKGIRLGGGIVDGKYTGEVFILLKNTSFKTFVVEKGQKIAQIALYKIYDMDIIEVDELEQTKRGSGGFGSTGKF